MPERTYTVAVIAGDGIGPELVESALTVLDAVTSTTPFALRTVAVDGGAGTYQREGAALSDAGLAAVRSADATLKGPVGLPHVRMPDGTEAGLLGGILRNGLDLYANVRPVTLLPGVESRLRVEPGAIDYVIVRENTEGLYASRGKGVGNERAMADTLLVTRAGCERIVRHAFDLALRRSGAPADGVRRVTCVDKANVLRSMYFFRSVFLEVAEEYPGVEAECRYVDAMAQALVMEPEHFDVVVTESMFGDILSDLGGGTVGGVALCPGGNIGDARAYFEPIHGSAPTLAGQDRANPLSQILAAAMMLDHLGEPAAGDLIRGSVRTALASGAIRLRRDGTAEGGTRAVTDAVVGALGS
ncbi:isocitrate/isopropylmalate dehydrogenase family protein [Streptomyces sp. NPDC020917]|uniref:isocitrate/isopropylmalate dehydrogenase family protein n=1 Tax=Streptomyces sp. NPDC020917 TaxID=3365102 RepID=UPI00378A02EB